MMRTKNRTISLALGAGILLTSMIATNSYLSTWSSPLIASWFAHGSGAIFSWILLIKFGPKLSVHSSTVEIPRAPLWSYLGGIPGALTVVLAAIAVNSPLKLSGTLGLMLAGQIIFGFLSDLLGWFGVIKIQFSMSYIFSLMLILSGCILLIIYK